MGFTERVEVDFKAKFRPCNGVRQKRALPGARSWTPTKLQVRRTPESTSIPAYHGGAGRAARPIARAQTQRGICVSEPHHLVRNLRNQFSRKNVLTDLRKRPDYGLRSTRRLEISGSARLPLSVVWKWLDGTVTAILPYRSRGGVRARGDYGPTWCGCGTRLRLHAWSLRSTRATISHS